MTVEVHLTTVHPRDDVRIFVKQCRTLARAFSRKLYLVVADSLGDACVDDVEIRDIGRPARGRLGRFVIGSWRAFWAVRGLKADLVHFHDPELLPTALLLGLLGHKVVYDVHEDMPRQILAKDWLPRGIRHLTAAVVGAAEWIGGLRFDGIVAATPAIASRFPPQKTVLVQNFPIIEELATGKITPQYGRERAFAYIGAIASIRGAREMVEAVGRLAGDEAEAVGIRLAGSFSPVTLRAELERLPGWSQIDYLGWLGRTEIAELLGRVRGGLVVLHPTKNYPDALPVKMFEYMAAGLPVVASDFPLWREIIEQSGCGLLVDPLDPAAIANAMQWIVEHPDEADDMGSNGRRAVLERYNWTQESEKLIALYQRLLVKM